MSTEQDNTLEPVFEPAKTPENTVSLSDTFENETEHTLKKDLTFKDIEAPDRKKKKKENKKDKKSKDKNKKKDETKSKKKNKKECGLSKKDKKKLKKKINKLIDKL